jgi:hypothetical protein
MDISGISKSALLMELFNAMPPAESGPYRGVKMTMTRERAMKIIKAHRTHHFPFEFRELEGRLIEIDITTGKFDPTLYNHKFGTGAAERVIKELRKKYP